MKVFALLVSLNIFYTVNAQHLFVLDDNDFYALIKVNSKSKATVHGVFLGGRLKGLADGHYTFYMNKDTIQYKTFDDEGNYDDTKGKGIYHHYPWYLPINNNDFKVSTIINDSLVYDDSGRIREVYGQRLGEKSKGLQSRLKYLNDTTILVIDITYLNINSVVYLYQLDNKRRLRAINESSILTKQAIVDSVSFDKILFWKDTRFNYNKSKARIDSIQIFNSDGKTKRLFSTQYFDYKNKRPARSYIKDWETNMIIYRQRYKYTSVK